MTEHRVQIVNAAATASGLAPEIAAMRLIAALSYRWTVELQHCTEDTATIGIVAPGPVSAAVVELAVDQALRQPGLAGWTRSRGEP